MPKVGQKLVSRIIPEDGQTERDTRRKFYSKMDLFFFFIFSTKHFDKISNLTLRVLLNVNKAKKKSGKNIVKTYEPSIGFLRT